jgi:hypothetical protein
MSSSPVYTIPAPPIVDLNGATTVLTCSECHALVSALSTGYHTGWHQKLDVFQGFIDELFHCSECFTLVHASQREVHRQWHEAEWGGEDSDMVPDDYRDGFQAPIPPSYLTTD